MHAHTHTQDNRYENQRYTLKAGSINDTDNDDVFDVPVSSLNV